jgi:hypothetical protein
MYLCITAASFHPPKRTIESLTSQLKMTPNKTKLAIENTLKRSGIGMLLSFSLSKQENTLQYLKGQCHEMVVEVRPWSGSLALN